MLLAGFRAGVGIHAVVMVSQDGEYAVPGLQAKYSAIFWKKLEVNDLFFNAIPGQRDLAAAKIDIKSKKTTRS